MPSTRLPRLLPLLALAAPHLLAAPPVDLDAALRQWLGDQPHGVAAAWIDASGVTFANAGRFDAADARPITPDTYFEIGSLTKVFTATLLADAVQQGRLKLDDSVGAPFAPSAITYRQLVTHTSGLPRMARDFTPRGGPDNPYGAVNLDDLARSFAAAAPDARPGKSSYSNFGYAVLGQAVAHADGQSYAEALRARVLAPLGLAGTFVTRAEVDAARLAPGHSDSGRTPNWDFDAYAPAGSLLSTARELARFVQAELSLVETPLNALLVETQQPLAAGDLPARRIGHAWMIETRGPDTVLWHNGATGGYHSFLVFDPLKKTGLVLLTNSSRGLEAMGFALLAGRMPPPPPKPPAEVKLPADVLAGYVGVYTLGPVEFTVTEENGAMAVQLTGQSRLPMFASAKDEFFLKVVPARISFERDASGRVAALVLHQNGRDQRATRK